MAKATVSIESRADWKENFRRASMRVGFQLALSKTMLEFLCAVAEDVTWDRALYGGLIEPDHYVTTCACLTKRGLIERKPEKEIKDHVSRNGDQIWEWTHMKLTPAGECVVELLKLCGMFVEADTAIRRKARRA